MSEHHSSCLFCRLLRKELPCESLLETEHFHVILDAFPSTPGMALILTKQHHSSDFTQLPQTLRDAAWEVAERVAAALKSVFDTERVALVMEGMGVDHFHIKLYPLHGVTGAWRPLHAPVRAYWEQYPGFLTTQMGPQAAPSQLAEIGKQLRSVLDTSQAIP